MPADEDDDEDDEDEERKEDEAVNFFALKELMNIEYVLLTKSELPCFDEMAHAWSNSKKYLMMVMNLLRYEDKQLKVEVILQFSLFILRGQRSEPILNIIARNKDYLIELLSSF